MLNNVKSFPPEWNEFDSNNFGGTKDAETPNLLIFDAVNPVTTGTGNAFAMSAGYVLSGSADAVTDNFNKSGRV